MKNVKLIVMAILAGLMMVACTPKKEKLLRAYENACQKGDLTEALRVTSEMEKEFGDAEPDSIYSPADLARFEAATAILEQKVMQDALDQVSGVLEATGQATKDLYGLDDDDEDEDEDDD